MFRFCVLPVFLSLLFYREDIDILYTFHVVLRVYFTNILCTFNRHYKAIFFVHFIDISCSSFGGNFMKILLTFYFFLSVLQRLCSHFKRFFCVYFKISVNFDWTVRVHAYRHCILQGRYRDFTEIFVTFVMSINGSSFPVRAHKLDWAKGSYQDYLTFLGCIKDRLTFN